MATSSPLPSQRLRWTPSASPPSSLSRQPLGRVRQTFLRGAILAAFGGLVLSSCVLSAQDWEAAPRPEQFAVGKVFSGKPATAILNTRKARRFRTVIREGASRGPNFAGHYTVVPWGCGLDSFELVVVDAQTGKLYFPPFGCISLRGPYGESPPEWSELGNPAFRIDSRLILIIGVEDAKRENWGDRAARYYVFDRGHFKMVRKFPVLAYLDGKPAA
jgi:hypothetical protein